ncbi:hypothetical protein Ccrd_026760, partial [Cynara cardunculus var. scolymus]
LGSFVVYDLSHISLCDLVFLVYQSYPVIRIQGHSRSQVFTAYITAAVDFSLFALELYLTHKGCLDFIARRSRLVFLDTDAAGRALPRVIEILAAEHHWQKQRQKQDSEIAISYHCRSHLRINYREALQLVGNFCLEEELEEHWLHHDSLRDFDLNLS